jgi:hypothetical protein
MVWLADAGPFATEANCRLVGAAEIVEGFVAAAKIATESLPVVALTVMVSSPVRLEGRAAVIDVLLHELTDNVVGLLDSAGVAVTLQELHELPNVAPVKMIFPPAVTTRGELESSGPIDT